MITPKISDFKIATPENGSQKDENEVVAKSQLGEISQLNIESEIDGIS